jgi:hypothetical protein
MKRLGLGIANDGLKQPRGFHGKPEPAMCLCNFEQQIRPCVQPVGKRPMPMEKIDELKIVLCFERRLKARTKKPHELCAALFRPGIVFKFSRTHHNLFVRP